MVDLQVNIKGINLDVDPNYNLELVKNRLNAIPIVLKNNLKKPKGALKISFKGNYYNICCCFWYSVGVSPTKFLKILLKEVLLGKPAS